MHLLPHGKVSTIRYYARLRSSIKNAMKLQPHNGATIELKPTATTTIVLTTVTMVADTIIALDVVVAITIAILTTTPTANLPSTLALTWK